MESINPFADPEFKKTLMEKEGLSSESNNDAIEELEPEELKTIIQGAPVIPKAAKNMILDASAMSKGVQEQKVREMENSLNQVLSNYNKEFGLDLHLNLTDLSKSLVLVSDDKNRRILELYLSKIYRSIKPILYLHLIQKLSLTIDYVLDPQRLFGNEGLSSADYFIVVEKLIQYIDQLSQLRGEIEISGDSLELKKIAEEDEGIDLSDSDSQRTVEEFMRLFRKENEE
jgi:hypothetical protein